MKSCSFFIDRDSYFINTIREQIKIVILLFIWKIMEKSFLVPFLLTLFAGLATGIGSVIAFLPVRPISGSYRFRLVCR